MAGVDQTPEQETRDVIDQMLRDAGWAVQDSRKIDFRAGPSVPVREYGTDIGPADYLLFVDGKPIGVVEAKPEDCGH